MSAFPWPLRPRRPTSPPDSPARSPVAGASATQERSPPKSRFSACRLRRGFLASILLPLLIVSAPEVEAQTVPAISVCRASSDAEVTEGATVIHTLTASPAPTADLSVTVRVRNNTGHDFLVSGEAG